jgi:predicted RNase H-like nuclease
MDDRGKTIGVDLAAQSKETAVCVLNWSHRRATMGTLAVGAGDDDILDLVRAENPAKVAIDAPFGWPNPFVTAVSQHAAGERWNARETRALRLRTTDLAVIAQTGAQPLSVSADRIAVTAFRCAGLLSQLATAGYPANRAGDELVVEVYPAAAMRQWGLNPRGYKGSKPEQQARRAQLVVDLATRSESILVLDAEQRARLAASDHLFDALICALIARAALIGATIPIPNDVRALAAVEGWIALPHTASLSKLGGVPVDRGGTGP